MICSVNKHVLYLRVEVHDALRVSAIEGLKYFIHVVADLVSRKLTDEIEVYLFAFDHRISTKLLTFKELLDRSSLLRHLVLPRFCGKLMRVGNSVK